MVDQHTWIQKTREVGEQVNMGLEIVNNLGPLIALNMDQLVGCDSNMLLRNVDLPRVVYQLRGSLQLSDSSLSWSWEQGSMRCGSKRDTQQLDRSSHKKRKLGECSSDGHNQVVIHLRDMTVWERCLEIVNALPVEDESLDVPMENKELWEN